MFPIRVSMTLPYRWTWHSPRATIRITLVRSSGHAADPGLTPLRLPRAPKCHKRHKSAASAGLFSDVPQISMFPGYVSLSFGSDKSRILIWILAVYVLELWLFLSLFGLEDPSKSLGIWFWLVWFFVCYAATQLATLSQPLFVTWPLWSTRFERRGLVGNIPCGELERTSGYGEQYPSMFALHVFLLSYPERPKVVSPVLQHSFLSGSR